MSNTPSAMGTAPDPGLQPERTELAWRRTALALALLSLVSMRLLPEAFGSGWWALVGAAGLVAAAAVWGLAHRRARTVTAMLADVGVRGRMPGAALLFGLAGVTCAIGVTGAITVFVVSASALQ
ncbi:MAG TPA: DUF202 domain-containing protein [Microbacteriaceae bacterium]|nr:DUF202 domain-containing protein [Microbacteriaceae bacterium]